MACKTAMLTEACVIIKFIVLVAKDCLPWKLDIATSDSAFVMPVSDRSKRRSVVRSCSEVH